MLKCFHFLKTLQIIVRDRCTDSKSSLSLLSVQWSRISSDSRMSNHHWSRVSAGQSVTAARPLWINKCYYSLPLRQGRPAEFIIQITVVSVKITTSNGSESRVSGPQGGGCSMLTVS